MFEKDHYCCGLGQVCRNVTHYTFSPTVINVTVALCFFNDFSFPPVVQDSEKILLVISSSQKGPVSLQPFFVSSRNSCIGALRDDTMNGCLGF